MSNDQYIRIIEGQARIEQKLDNYKETQDQNSKDSDIQKAIDQLESLNSEAKKL